MVSLEERECCWVPQVSSMMDTKKSNILWNSYQSLEYLIQWDRQKQLVITHTTPSERRTVLKRCASTTDLQQGIGSLALNKAARKTSTSMARTSSWKTLPNTKCSSTNLISSSTSKDCFKNTTNQKIEVNIHTLLIEHNIKQLIHLN